MVIEEGLKTDPCPRCGLIAAELIYRDEYTFCPRCWRQFNFKVKSPGLGSITDVETDRKATEEAAEYKWWKIALGHYVCEHGEDAYKIEDDGKAMGGVWLPGMS